MKIEKFFLKITEIWPKNGLMIAVGPLQRLGSVFQGNTEQSRAEQYRAELTEPTELGSARSSTGPNSSFVCLVQVIYADQTVLTEHKLKRSEFFLIRPCKYYNKNFKSMVDFQLNEKFTRHHDYRAGHSFDQIKR